MKRETLRNGLILSVLGMTFCLSTAIMVTSCQKQSFDDAPIAPQSAQSRAAEELPYLDFSDNYSEKSDLSNEDLEILIAALNRAHIKKVDGLWQMTVSDETALNISPRIMTCLKQIIENSNAKIVSRLSVMRVTPRVRKPGGGEGADDLEQESSDCVAKCFGWIREKLGFGPSYGTANSWINDRFGGVGVPVDSMEFTLQHFYGPDHVSSFPVNSQPNGYIHNDMNSAVILNQRVDDSTCHAVIYISTSNGTHVVQDPQNSYNYDFVGPNDVESAYQITK